MGQLNVLNDGAVLVPLRADGVSCCQDGGASIERTDDASLGNGQSLLLHHLMKNGPRTLTHLVKLIYTAYTIITQHQRSTANNTLYLNIYLHFLTKTCQSVENDKSI